MNGLFNVIEVTQMAINIEEKGLAYYNEAAKRANDDKIKGIFLLLAEQEKKHIELFAKLLELLSDIHNIDSEYLYDESVSSYFKALVGNQVFKDNQLNNVITIENTKDALNEGIAAEKNSILFYNEILKHTKLQAVTDVLEIIIEEEKKHIIDLNSILKTL